MSPLLLARSVAPYAVTSTYSSATVFTTFIRLRISIVVIIVTDEALCNLFLSIWMKSMKDIHLAYSFADCSSTISITGFKYRM